MTCILIHTEFFTTLISLVLVLFAPKTFVCTDNYGLGVITFKSGIFIVNLLQPFNDGFHYCIMSLCFLFLFILFLVILIFFIEVNPSYFIVV